MSANSGSQGPPRSVPGAKRDTRFKKGQSGNPNGRPRKKSGQSEVSIGSILLEELGRKATVTVDGRKQKKTASYIGIRTLVAQFAKGDRHARHDVFDLAQRTGIDVLGDNRHLLEEALVPDHQAILDDYVARKSRQISALAVIASPELMDDL